MKRHRLRRNTSKSNAMNLTPVRLMLFNDRHLLDCENPAEYDGLVAAIKAVDVFDEMLIADIVYLEWDVLRWRRLKLGFIRSCALKVLKDFLAKELDYALYQDRFTDCLTEILQNNLAKDEAEDSARTLARDCARNEPDAVEKITEIFARIGWNMNCIHHDAQLRKAKELVQQYVRGEPEAITLIGERLTRAGVTMDSLVAEAVAQELDKIERIDHLMTLAENRRNAALREIDRRHAILGQALERAVQEVEDGECELIERMQEAKEAA